MLHQVRKTVRERHPLIHCITNPISINQCANAILAVGARPIMAEHPKEAAGITGTAQALLLNLGNITDIRMASMQISAGVAAKRGIPMVLDAVGVSCSELRREFAGRLMEERQFAVVKGNYSEINTLYCSSYRSPGVDADQALEPAAIQRAAAGLARKYHTVILASGEADIVTDGSRTVLVRNGTPQLAAVTGTGCMLGALCACYLSAERSISAAVAACAVLGIAGELSETPKGPGSFLVNLMDRLSTLDREELDQHLNLEEQTVENF